MKNSILDKKKQHVFIIGAKGLNNYGGFETFVDKLTEYHANNSSIMYHIACKENGSGFMDESQLDNVTESESFLYGKKVIKQFIYHNAHCFKIHVPEKIGPAQAVYYDIEALKESIAFCERNTIDHPIFYLLACRIGPFIGSFTKRIHKLNGVFLVNPDGHEWLRSKWKKPIRCYWKLSERLMIKHADVVICDSINIETYIKETYKRYKPKTKYISYGAEIEKSNDLEYNQIFEDFMQDNNLNTNAYYLIVGRFVPENNYETIVREFMQSETRKSLAIISTVNQGLYNSLNNKLNFVTDDRIKFVGTVYDKSALKRIRINAFGYIHGHSVGGTNPSLLEALGTTNLNLLYDVGFNREVGGDAAYYWTNEYGDLASLINKVEKLSPKEINHLGEKAKERIDDNYTWDYIANQYSTLFRSVQQQVWGDRIK